MILYVSNDVSGAKCLLAFVILALLLAILYAQALRVAFSALLLMNWLMDTLALLFCIHSC
jgi:hypothetical protein